MPAVIQHLTAADYVISQWSGGLTTQIAIAPQGAHYANRDFLWRISSATVELAQSDFTPLPEYDRYLSLLQGQLLLTHEHLPPISLLPFEVHAFDGGIATKSQGRCVDFNLMLQKGRCTGCLSALHLAGDGEASAQPVSVHTAACDTLLLYCANGGGELRSEHQAVNLLANEAALVEQACQQQLQLYCQDSADFLVARIRFR